MLFVISLNRAFKTKSCIHEESVRLSCDFGVKLLFVKKKRTEQTVLFSVMLASVISMRCCEG